MKEIFYAVQHGDCHDWDNGSADYSEAVKMANAMAKDPEYKDEEIRIATIDVEANYCEDMEVIRESLIKFLLWRERFEFYAANVTCPDDVWDEYDRDSCKCPEIVKEFTDEAEALAALEKCENVARFVRWSPRNLATGELYYVEKTEYDEDGELIQGLGIYACERWDFDEWLNPAERIKYLLMRDDFEFNAKGIETPDDVWDEYDLLRETDPETIKEFTDKEEALAALEKCKNVARFVKWQPYNLATGELYFVEEIKRDENDEFFQYNGRYTCDNWNFDEELIPCEED